MAQIDKATNHISSLLPNMFLVAAVMYPSGMTAASYGDVMAATAELKSSHYILYL